MNTVSAHNEATLTDEITQALEDLGYDVDSDMSPEAVLVRETDLGDERTVVVAVEASGVEITLYDSQRDVVTCVTVEGTSTPEFIRDVVRSTLQIEIPTASSAFPEGTCWDCGFQTRTTPATWMVHLNSVSVPICDDCQRGWSRSHSTTLIPVGE